MYWLTPFHYLLEGFLGVAVHGRPVRCESREFARFAAPPGQTCASYTKSYIQQAGGYVQTASDGLCELCAYSTGDEWAASFNVYYSHRWRDFGIFALYCAFNFAMVFFFSWLYLGGAKSIKRRFTGKKAGKGSQA